MDQATHDAEDLHDRRRLRRSLALVLMSGCSVVVLVASALYTETVSPGSNTFTIGTLDITSVPTTAAITASNMVNGSKSTATLQVNNAGSLTMRYAIKSTTTENVLAAELDLTIKSGVATCDNDSFGASGSVLYGPAALGSTAGLNVVGNPAQGVDANDRQLSASTNEVLCLQVLMPATSGSSFQGLTTTATIALIAEQTANNPP
jgi:hypothetical protein